jgi:hypothetical protein
VDKRLLTERRNAAPAPVVLKTLLKYSNPDDLPEALVYERRKESLSIDQIKELKAEGRIKIQLSDISKEMVSHYAEAMVTTSESPEKSSELKLVVERASRLSRDEWVICAPSKKSADAELTAESDSVERFEDSPVLEKVENVELEFAIKRDGPEALVKRVQNYRPKCAR